MGGVAGRQGSDEWNPNTAGQPARRSTRGRKRRTEPILTRLEDGSYAELTPKEYRAHRRYVAFWGWNNMAPWQYLSAMAGMYAQDIMKHLPKIACAG